MLYIGCVKIKPMANNFKFDEFQWPKIEIPKAFFFNENS